MMMSSGLKTHQPMRVICVKMVCLDIFNEMAIMVSHACMKNVKLKQISIIIIKKIAGTKRYYL